MRRRTTLSISPIRRIASCPIVENGVLRVLNLPSYSSVGPLGFALVSEKMAQVCSHLDHQFWPDDASLLLDGVVNWPRVLGHQQVTDVYLLAVAVRHQECLVTLDHRISLSTVSSSADSNLLRL
jgi:uncharacterized protein